MIRRGNRNSRENFEDEVRREGRGSSTLVARSNQLSHGSGGDCHLDIRRHPFNLAYLERTALLAISPSLSTTVEARFLQTFFWIHRTHPPIPCRRLFGPIPLAAVGRPLLAYSLSSPIGTIEYHPELILLMLFRCYCDM